MIKSKGRKIPRFRSLDKLIKFFETHDMGEYWDEMPEAHFEVNIKKRIHLFSLDAELESKLTEIAKLKHVSSQRLINAWLKEKLQEQRKRGRGERQTAYNAV